MSVRLPPRRVSGIVEGARAVRAAIEEREAAGDRPGGRRTMGQLWDDAVAATLVGKRVHLELEYAGPGGRVIRRARFCGRVLAADRCGGIDLRIDDRADAFRLPPDLSTFEWAYPGEYPDDATGELVENPDVRATWHITAPERPPDAFWRMFGRREGEGHAA